MPNIRQCTECGSKDEISHFSIKDNGIKCKTCAKLDKSVIHISNSTLYAIRYIVMSEAKRIFSFSVPEDSVEELKLIANVYLDEKLEKNYRFEKII